MAHRSAGAATRRELLLGGIAVAGAAGAAGAIPGPAPALAAAPAPGDAALLTSVVGAELLGIFSYQHVLATNLLTADGESAAGEMLGQLMAHRHAFQARLVRLGGTPPAPLSDVGDADKVLVAHHIPNSLAHLRSERDAITLLVRVENLIAATLWTALPHLTDARSAQLASEAMSNGAQHYTVLNWLLRPGNLQEAVPGPFFHGTQ